MTATNTTSDVLVDLTDGDCIEVTPGVIDDRAKFAFRHGQCHGLVLALKEQLGDGWTIRVFVDPYQVLDGAEPEPGEDLLPGFTWDDDGIEARWNRDLTRGVELPGHLLDEYGTHTMVEGPDGALLDISGVQTRESIRDLFIEYTASVEDLRSMTEWRQAGPVQDLGLARVFARALLDALPDLPRG